MQVIGWTTSFIKGTFKTGAFLRKKGLLILIVGILFGRNIGWTIALPFSYFFESVLNMPNVAEAITAIIAFIVWGGMIIWGIKIMKMKEFIHGCLSFVLEKYLKKAPYKMGYFKSTF